MKKDINIILDIEFQTVAEAPLSVSIGIDQNIYIDEKFSSQRRQFQITDSLYTGPHRLFINFVDKPYDLCSPELDIAVIIHSVKFQHIKSDFKDYSKYQPVYPYTWAAEQTEQGKKLEEIIVGNYLGWDGKWFLDFETPVYRWIHRTLNLGWLI